MLACSTLCVTDTGMEGTKSSLTWVYLPVQWGKSHDIFDVVVAHPHNVQVTHAASDRQLADGIAQCHTSVSSHSDLGQPGQTHMTSSSDLESRDSTHWQKSLAGYLTCCPVCFWILKALDHCIWHPEIMA